VKGVLFLLVAAFFFSGWLISLFISSPGGNQSSMVDLERLGPLGLLGISVMNLLVSTGERVISFRPAEVDFLFPAPFTRRQLLAYKLVSMISSTLFQALILAVVFRNMGRTFLSAYVGVVLILLLMQLFALALTMIANTVGARAYSLGRRLVLVALGMVVVAVIVGAWRSMPDVGPEEMLDTINQSPVWQVIQTPFSWFVKAFRAEQVWPDLVHYGLLALLVNLFLIAVIFALDAQYLEASAAASEKQYQRMQRLRSGQGVLAGASGSKARFTLPMLPRLRGAGPILWRQLVTVARSYLPLILLISLLGITAPVVILSGQHGEEEGVAAYTLAAMLLGFPVFLTPTVLCDFRGDVDRLDVLKSLPLAPTWLVLGQVLAPAIVLCLVQFVGVILLQGVLQRFEPILMTVPLLAVPVNFVLFGLENLLFLLFPVRIGPGTGSDFQTSGRYMVVFLAKFLCLAPILLMGSVTFGVIHWLTSSLAASLAGVWLVVLASGLALMPLIVFAFHRFDVARDTPA
jgi:hypothetical protein